MTLGPWHPLHELEALRREIDRAFDTFRSDEGVWPFSRMAFLPGRAARAYPLVNVYEDTDAVYVSALAPGVDPKSLDVSVHGDTLTISGEKPGTNGDIKPDAYHRAERAAGRFTRTFSLPAEVDPDKVEATYRHGILSVKLPKAEQAKPKQIDIKVG